MYASLNAPQRPAKPAQRKDLLFLFFAQDIHRRRVNLRHSQCLVPLSRWPLFRCPPMAGFWCPPRLHKIFLQNRTKKNWKESIIRFAIAAIGNEIITLEPSANTVRVTHIDIQEDGIRTSISKFHKGSIC